MLKKTFTLKSYFKTLALGSVLCLNTGFLEAMPSLNNLPLELTNNISSFLDVKDQTRLGATCHAFNSIVKEDHKRILKPLVHNPNAPFSPVQKQEAQQFLDSYPKRAHFLLTELKKERLEEEKKLFDSRGYLVKSCSDPMETDLNRHFLATKKASVLTLYDLLPKEQKSSLKTDLFGPIDHPNHDTLLRHMMKQYQYYVSNFILETQKQGIVETLLNDDLITSLKDIKAQKNYVFYQDKENHDLSEKPATIIVSAAEMLENKRTLEHILEDNPAHTLMVTVDESVVHENTLSLSYNQMPENLRHLVISDAHQDVHHIGDHFLMASNNLQSEIIMSFETLGFTALKTIGNDFLFYAERLNHIDISELTALEEIGSYFLEQARNLYSFDTSRFTSLKTIKNSFLANCFSLERFDTSGLTSLKSIGTTFLYDVDLTRFDTWGLTALEEIGGCFLMKARAITHFDASGLTALEKIGSKFLHGTKKPSITGFEALPNKKGIQKALAWSGIPI